MEPVISAPDPLRKQEVRVNETGKASLTPVEASGNKFELWKKWAISTGCRMWIVRGIFVCCSKMISFGYKLYSSSQVRTRWWNILLTSLLFGALYYFVGFSVFNLIAPQLDGIFAYGFSRGVFELSFLGSLILISYFILRTKRRHFLYIDSHPPYPIAMWMGCLWLYLIYIIQEASESHVTYSLIIYTFCILIWGAKTWCDEIAKPLAGETEPDFPPLPDPSKLNDEEYVAWYQNESPASEQADMLGHRHIASKLLKKLDEGKRQGALIGDFGTGKSTVFKYLRQQAAKQNSKAIFVEVGCWGITDVTKSHQYILEKVIECLGKEFDCFGLEDIPAKYIEALKITKSEFINAVDIFLPKAKEPKEQLKRLVPMLEAVDRYVVILIEDVDRNWKKDDLSMFQTLLVQIHDTKRLSFILAISPTQHIDFSRTCDFVEWINTIDRTYTLRVFRRHIQFWQNKLSKEESVYTKHINTLQFDFPDSVINVAQRRYGNPEAKEALSNSIITLVKSPRQLKRILNRADETWYILKHEICWDDIFVVSILKTIVPEAYSFYLSTIATAHENAPFWDSGSKEHNSVLSNLKARYRMEIEEVLPLQWAAIGILLSFLDPKFTKIVGCEFSPRNIGPAQSIAASSRANLYAQKLLTESASIECPNDRDLLYLIHKTEANDDALQDLVNIYCNEQSVRQRLSLREFHVSQICIQRFAERMITDLHSAEIGDVRYGYACSLASSISGHYDNINARKWLATILKKCKQNLYAMNEIMRSSKVVEEVRDEVRKDLCNYWKGGNSISYRNLTSALPVSQPTLLRELFQNLNPGIYNSTRSEVQTDSLKDWNQAGDMIVFIVKQRPDYTMHILYSLSMQIDSDANYSLDLHLVDQLFGDNALKVKLAISQIVSWKVADRYRPIVDKAISDAR
ncbi:hypothetical protein DB346_11610 [Verrucomicrobia bacterium LW23]|nr:hypothetical protein DB346_11610 [Verrucomicrobia bacterium LW23]